jgi:pyruvate formate lyase activating enzyme
MFWSAAECGSIFCELCPHRCNIKENQRGICGVRENRNRVLIAAGYGLASSIALDPIEKKPLYMFHPGKRITSIGSYGCSFRCQFCQNSEISVEFKNSIKKAEHVTPEIIAEIAVETVQDGNIGVAYTYNEPFVGYEFVFSCATLIRKAGLKNILVTNGYINPEPLEALLPFIDAMNIDIKGYNGGTYDRVGGTLEVVKNTVEMSFKACHVEVTTLVLPGENEDDVEDIAKWISSLDKELPYHLSRFYPRYKYSDRTSTSRETMFKLKETAERYLKNVFLGNM